MGLQSLDRIDRMIDEGLIKRIFVDGGIFGKSFVGKIDELFGNRVDVYSMYMNRKYIEGFNFKSTDYILLDETFIKQYKGYEVLLNKLNAEGVFVKILSEDIYNVDKLKDGYNNVKMEDEWNNLSKGYNFVLKYGDMYYSVDFVNRVLE